MNSGSAPIAKGKAFVASQPQNRKERGQKKHRHHTVEHHQATWVGQPGLQGMPCPGPHRDRGQIHRGKDDRDKKHAAD